eukprot:NODE_782_length_1364_cov_109.884645.p1 GENE.NODE_782_length_1364_cov_109.884645~~NODE_782_length_1364_cov_109.884645.p1  ORF type:complete len:358 (-),score=92.91 NODE_782_length_1364_cov_109.884645:266-1339(-)
MYSALVSTQSTWVSHAWSEPVNTFLRDVLIITAERPDEGMFICFLALYQGTWEEVDLQVSQGGTTMHDGCFAQVLSSVKRNEGEMWVISNQNECKSGLYARLWCTWELYCAWKEGVPVKLHPLTSSEKHLYGEGGEKSFEPENGFCGCVNDLAKIKTAVEGGAGWGDVKYTVLWNSVWSARSGRLEAAGNNLGPMGMVHLMEAMKTETGEMHTVWDLARNGFGDEGAKALADCFPVSKTLVRLNALANGIGDEGAKALASALEGSTGLEMLELHFNVIGDAGAKALARALKKNTTLKTLNLATNAIEDEGAKALADALHENDTLESLYLNSNKIGDEGVRALQSVGDSVKCCCFIYW